MPSFVAYQSQSSSGLQQLASIPEEVLTSPSFLSSTPVSSCLPLENISHMPSPISADLTERFSSSLPLNVSIETSSSAQMSPVDFVVSSDNQTNSPSLPLPSSVHVIREHLL